MSDPNRQRLGHTEARERILEAAAVVYNQRGQAMTVEEIATQAGYSTSALYKHFANRDDILCTLWRFVRARITEVMEQPPPDDLCFRERSRWLLYNLAEFAEQERELFLAAMVNSPMGPPSGKVDEEILSTYRANQRVWLELMEAGIASGELREADPLDYVLALGGHLHSLTVHWAFEGPFEMKPAIDRVLEIFMEGAGRR